MQIFVDTSYCSNSTKEYYKIIQNKKGYNSLPEGFIIINMMGNLVVLAGCIYKYGVLLLHCILYHGICSIEYKLQWRWYGIVQMRPVLGQYLHFQALLY